MRLDHEFTVPAPLAQVWNAVNDLERVMPCMPGATLTTVAGETFTGTVKVKLGPISLLYRGAGEFLEIDELNRKIVIKASGKDARGAGTAAATITVTLAEQDGSTKGTVQADLNVTGRPAQFGRGMIAEVGGKILDQFAANLAEQLGSSGEKAEPTPSAESRAGTSAAGAGAQEPKFEAVTPATQQQAEAIDVFEYAGSSVIKRLAPAFASLAAILTVVVIVHALRRR